MNDISVIDEQQFFKNLQAKQNPFFSDYYAFYSSWLGGITKNPHLMLVPVDDHMVHRGDGVFEGIKAVNRSVYQLDEHLQRLFTSAERIAIKPPVTQQKLKEIVIETLRVADQPDAIIRIFISRGPGNFSVNPYDPVASQLYIMIHKYHPPSAEKYEHGVSLGKSTILAKPSWMAQVKSCNYLPNVLMKKEAVDRQFDFVIGLDEEGFITESATENILIIDEEGAIVHPRLDHILKGLTMLRICELAREDGFKTKIKSISINDLLSAREVFVAGTTLDVLPVVKFEDKQISDGKPGVATKRMRELMVNDIQNGPKLTPF